MTDHADPLSRRGFLQATTVAAASTLAASAGAPAPGDGSVIFLMLVGGPSQLETFDPKPDAPANVRGPFRSIATRVPGLRLSETLPKLADMADTFALVRSLHHDAPPIHETGFQLVQTGKLFVAGREYAHPGAVAAKHLGPRSAGATPWVVLPHAVGNTGVGVSHGQTAGPLGEAYAPRVLPLGSKESAAFDLSGESSSLRDRYGRTPFGEACLTARRLVEAGTRFVTVNMFETVFGETTWDCHADGGSLATTVADVGERVCPAFDAGCSALLADLNRRGMLQKTLVVAVGEFGRTPHLNPRGGRDHWPGVWSALLAGGAVKGGQVIGSSDKLGGEPKDKPVAAAEIAATVYRHLGVPA